MSAVTADDPRAAAASHSPSAAKLFRPDIEGLRALAVLGVIAFHFGMSDLPGGFVGVDIFFVISGYLITQHLVQELDKHGTVDLWAFYARRARRLLPASIFVILVTLVAGYFILAPSEQQLYAKGALFASTYIINIWLIRWSLDYFAPDASNNPFIHFWSLSVEEQFYLAWPALLLVFARFTSGTRRLALLMATVGAVSLAACAWLTEVSQPWAFYLSPFRAWEFAFGGLASMAMMQRRARDFFLAPLLGWVGLVLIGWTYLTVTEETAFPGFIAIVPAAGTVLVLLAGARESRWGPSALLSLAPCQWVGRLSYSLYLWHWPVIVYAAMLKPELGLLDRVLLLALTFALSLFTYLALENPIRRNGWLIAGTGRSLGLAALLTASGAVVAYASATVAARSYSPELRVIAESAQKQSVVRRSDPGCVVDFSTVKPKPCVFGARSARDTIVLFGDSHADHWSSPIAEIADKEGFRLVTYLKSSCRATRITTHSWRLKRDYTECDEWRELAMKQIIAMKPALVIISQLSISHLEEEIENPAERPLRKKQWAEGIGSSLSALSDAGIKVVYLRDVPTHKTYIDKCVARAVWQKRSPSVCDTPRAAAADDRDSAIEKGIVTKIPNARYVDMTNHFCGETRCYAMVGGRLAFRDRHHIATPYAESLAGPLERAIFGDRVADAKVEQSPSHDRL